MFISVKNSQQEHQELAINEKSASECVFLYICFGKGTSPPTTLYMSDK